MTKLISFLILLILLILSLNNAYSRSITPNNENNNDLDKRVKIFQIDNFVNKRSIYTLWNVTQKKIVIEKIIDSKTLVQKIADDEADKVDQNFVALFINLKYHLSASENLNCQKKFVLWLRGDSQFICQDESVKMEKIKTFINHIEKTYLKINTGDL